MRNGQGLFDIPHSSFDIPHSSGLTPAGHKEIEVQAVVVDRNPALDRVIEPVRIRAETYAQLVRELVGENAKALSLFGPVVGGPFDANRHSAASVLVVDRVELSTLRRLADHGAKLGKLGLAAPLIMTPPYIRSSLDTFPLELIEIQQRHATLFGEDDFAELIFEGAHVRLQCERELKRALIALRQGLLATAGRERLVPALEHDAAEGLLRTLRGLLWLKGKKEFKPDDEVVTETETLLQRRVPGLRKALDRSAQPGWGDFDELYREVEALMETADAW